MSSPRPPSAPKLQKIDQYQSYKQHPLYKEFINDPNTKDEIRDDGDVRIFNAWALEREFKAARNDDDFVRAEKDLLREGVLRGASDIDFDSRAAEDFRKKFKGEGNWRAEYAAQRYKYTDRDDLQLVYDRVYELQQNEYTEKYNQSIADQTKAFQEAQDKATREAQEASEEAMEAMRISNEKIAADNLKAQQELMASQERTAAEQLASQEKMQAEQLAAQKELQEMADRRQQEMLEEMMNQPIYSPQQAALPKVQYNAKTPKPMPAQPAPPPAMNISPAPVPELVNTGNPMAIVKQSNTARTRARIRTRGTSTLT